MEENSIRDQEDASSPEPSSQQAINKATRYICAAAYHDSVFCDKVLALTWHEKNKAIGKCPGIDLSLLVRHCLQARKIRKPVESLYRLLMIVSLVSLPLMSFNLLLVSLPLMSFNLLLIYFAGWFLAFIVEAIHLIYIHRLIIQNFQTLEKEYIPRFDGDTERMIDFFTIAEQSSLLVFSGYDPFLSYGPQLGSWAVSIDLTKMNHSAQEIKSFKTSDLYDYVHDELTSRIPKLNATTLEVVRGIDVRKVPNLLTGFRPVFAPPRDERQGSNLIRMYRCYQLTDWHGELIHSMITRFEQKDTTLSLDISHRVLAAIKIDYRAIDDWYPGIMDLNAAPLAFSALFWPLHSITSWVDPVNRWRAERARTKALKKVRFFDYGPEASVRAMVNSNQYIHPFQEADAKRNAATLNEVLLNSIVKFLAEKGIDTQDLVNASTVISNHGLIMYGQSTVKSESLSIGENASAASVSMTNLMGLRRRNGKTREVTNVHSSK